LVVIDALNAKPTCKLIIERHSCYEKVVMRWCCIGFKANYEQAGGRGAAILMGRDLLGAPEVTLQYRAVDKGDEEFIKSERVMSCVIEVRIVFCPWCGQNVEEWYGKYVEVLYREGLKISY
jgi:hypothetical protein